MEIFEKKADIQTYLKPSRATGQSIGFVPTMGALHEGHLTLIKESLSANDQTVCSIFVNPIQFNNPSDLEKYPRTLEKDLEMLRNAGCHVVFAPTVAEMYPSPTAIQVDFGYQNTILEGASRPGHFSGVGIVVSKFFNIIQPDNVYFGQKDFQQCLVVRQLINEFSFPLKMNIIPTIREPDGLAMSSRNKRLNPVQRKISPLIYQCLKMAEADILFSPLETIRTKIFDLLLQSGEIKPEYLEFLDFESGKIIHHIQPGSTYAACIAAYAGDIRLIDNIIINT